MEAEQEQFRLRTADLVQLKRMELAFRSFLVIPEISPETIVGLARAIRIVQRLPFSSPDSAVSVSLDFDGTAHAARYRIEFSARRIEAEHEETSWASEGEHECFVRFSMSVDLDGGTTWRAAGKASLMVIDWIPTKPGRSDTP